MDNDKSQTTAKPPKLAEIATRIATHLARMEKSQPNPGKTSSQYWNANAWPAGSRVGIKYVSYQHESKLTKADALEYLAWLDAGNDGRHYAVLGFNARIKAESNAA